MKRSLLLLFSWAILLLLGACTPDANSPLKASEDDPYREFIPESEVFSLDAANDTLVEGEGGTLIVLPEGCFLDASGNPYDGPVELELAEATTLGAQIMGNLSSQDEGQTQNSKGTLFWNATTPDGEQLQVNPERPIYIEMPAYDPNGNLELRHGVRDGEGNMTWEAPVVPENFLTPMPIEDMNFYPAGFEEAVEQGMPFRSHLVADKKLKDSLFYAMSVTNPWFLTKGGIVEPDAHEMGLSWSYRSEGGRHILSADKIERPERRHAESDAYIPDSAVSDEAMEHLRCGIDPASIKVLRSENFAETLIASREFQERLPYLYKACSQDILEKYVEGMERKMWEIDQEVADMVEDAALKAKFEEFAGQKKTRLEEGNPVADVLFRHYQRRLKNTKNQLERALNKAKKELKEKNKVAEETIKEYERLLDQRQSYRMERFGFSTKKNGWFDVFDPNSKRLTEYVVPSMEGFKTDVEVINEDEFERVMVYLAMWRQNSLHRMAEVHYGPEHTDPNKMIFETGSGAWRNIPVPREESMGVFVVAWKGESAYFGRGVMFPGGETASIKPLISTKEEIEAELTKFDLNQAKINMIKTDLEYQAKFFAEQRRQRTLIEERGFLRGLFSIINSCCSDENRGLVLFKQNCSRCHSTDLSMDLTGPALYNVTKRRPQEWLYPWIKNSASVIESGDEYAIKIWEENRKAAMAPMPHLTDDDINDILTWIDNESDRMIINEGP